MANKHVLMKALVLCFCCFSTLVWGAEKPFVIVIDAGHGGKDPGAVGRVAKEKDLNLSVALKLGARIASKHKDVSVVYTRRTDRFVGLDDRAVIANRCDADLFVSIHANAASTQSVSGTETYVLGLARSKENLEVAKRENAAILLEDNYEQRYEGFDPRQAESYIIFEFIQDKHMDQSIEFASYVQRYFKSARRIDRGVKQAGFLVLRKTSMPAVLVEIGYLSNYTEEKYMNSAKGQTTIANAIYEAFVKYKRAFERKSL